MPNDRNGGRSLANTAIFGGLSVNRLIAVESRCSWRSYGSHEQIVGYLNATDSVYFVTKGKARVIIYSSVGKAVAFRDIGSGDMFGEYAAIDGGPRSASVEALKPCHIASMSSTAFRALLQAESSVAMALLQHLIAQVRFLTSRVYEFSTLAVKNRIHAELLRLACECDSDMEMVLIESPPTHAEIANRISTQREAVTRELNHLAKLGVIKRQGKALFFTDIQRLARMVQEATGE